MANNVLPQYQKALRERFSIVASNLQGIPVKTDSSSGLDYTSKDLGEFLKTITETIPNVRKAGNPKLFGVIEAALINANVVKSAINTKRMEALGGDRCKKAAAALSFYYNGAAEDKSIAGAAFTQVVP